MKRKVAWITLLLAGALLLGGCGSKASIAGKSRGAGQPGTGAEVTPGAVGAEAAANSASMNTPEGKAVKAEVLTELQGLEQDLQAIEADVLIDAEAEASGF